MSAETKLGIWRRSCDQLVALLDEYSQSLLSNLQRFQELGDKSGAETIRGCCLNCLAHLAVLCEVLSDVEPIQAGVDALCDSKLECLGKLAEDMRMEEYTRHDLLLGVCSVEIRPTPKLLTMGVIQVSLEKALGVFDARLARAPIESDTKLRHWKQTVAGLRSNFAAKVPDGRIPSLVRQTEWEHVRAEGSRYPDLVYRER